MRTGLTLAVAAILLAAPVRASAQTYDREADFSITSNAGVLTDGLEAGADFAARVYPRVRVGGSVTAAALFSLETNCFYGHHDCHYPFVRFGPFIEGRLLPREFADPWARVGVGIAIEAADHGQPRNAAADFVATAGVDLRAWWFVIGPFVEWRSFAGRNPDQNGYGIRLGVEW